MIYKENVFLITGGTGSFGTVLLRKLLSLGAKEVRVLSRDEKKQSDLKRDLNNSKVKFYIGDIRDKQSLYESFLGVDYVFHAAALKQVNTLENFPLEATKTNLFGAQNVIECSIDNKVKKIIFLSTDKAVEPINAMGLSKALMEKLVLSKPDQIGGTKLIITRFGNVIASRGSVIPIIVERMKNKLPITITNPSMTRFFMSLKDAVELVLYAFENGENGDIFIKKAKALKLSQLLEYLKLKLKSNPDILISNSFPGEKIHESLLTKEELSFAEDYQGYFKIPKVRNSSNNLIESYDSNNNLMSEQEIKDLFDTNEEILQMLK
jgi:UDP-glucose 4-epimerase